MREFLAAARGPEAGKTAKGAGLERSEYEQLKAEAAEFEKQRRLKLATNNGERV